MKFRITQTSNWQREEVREIATLEELLAFVKESKSPVIVSTYGAGIAEAGTLEVYDGYRE